MLLILLFASKLAATLMNFIQDCDEVFNYWEPLHFLQFGQESFQTWEYCHTYKLRSWAYISLYSIFSKAPQMFLEKDALFYATKFLLGLLSFTTEYYLYKAIQQSHDKYISKSTYNIKIRGTKQFNQIDQSQISKNFLIFLIFSPGMFISSTSFLPSAFGMYFITLAFAYSLLAPTKKNTSIIIAFVIFSGTWGWPFCLFFGLIYAIQRIIDRFIFSNFIFLVKTAVKYTVLIMVFII